MVSLVATLEIACQSVNWSGNVSSVADPNTVSTTITMNDDYSITATFWFGGGCFIGTAFVARLR